MNECKQQQSTPISEGVGLRKADLGRQKSYSMRKEKQKQP